MYLELRSKSMYWIFIVTLLFCGICVSFYNAQNAFGPSTESDVTCATRNLHHHDTNKNPSCYLLTHDSTGHFILEKKYRGRLGNNIFEFISTVGIAATLGYKPIIEPAHPLLKKFDINPKYISNISLTNVLRFTESQWGNKKWRNKTNLHSFNLTKVGFFQSWKYFSSIDDCVRDILVVKPFYLEQAKQFLKRKELESKTIIGIHVRRTDMIKKKDRVAEMSYLNKAMEYFRSRCKNVHFVVCSDDMKWSQANLNISDVTFSIFKEPITDLSLLSLCDHVIITVGTFGWWGGWLSGGTVVYLNLPPGSRKKYYYPPNWIGMSN